MKKQGLLILLLVVFFSFPILITQTADSKTESQTSCIVPPPGLVSWWPGDGDAKDYADSNDGNVGSGTTYGTGKIGQAFNFDGSTGHINIPDDGQGASLDGFTQLTIDAWINPNSIGWPDPESGGNISAIISKHDTTKANGVSFSLFQYNGKLRFAVAQTLNPDNVVGLVSNDDIPIGTWSHVAAVWRGGTDLALYLNGAEMAVTPFSEGTTPTTTAENDVPVNIGRVQSFSGTFVGPAAFFDGLIDEVDIFNRGLSETEIQNIYLAGSSGKCLNTVSLYLPVILNAKGEIGKIAFASFRDGDYEIYTMNSDGSDQTRLTFSIGIDADPSWSPDGKQIAFDSERNGPSEIYRMNANGSGQTRLTYSAAWSNSPDWSPDGSKIAFASQPNFNPDIYIMNADGSGMIRLTDSNANEFRPSWSPDGKHIAFESTRDGDSEIFFMKSDGSEQLRLTSNIIGDFDAAWSPDGNKIAFFSDRDGNLEIYVMNADGTGEKRLTNNNADDWSPAWSPDGSRIAFNSNRDSNIDVYWMKADGTQQTRITNQPNSGGWPDWGLVQP